LVFSAFIRQASEGAKPHVGKTSGGSGVVVAFGVGVGAGMEQIRSRSVVAGHVGIAGRVGFGGSSVGVGDGAVFVAIAWSNPGGGVGVGVVICDGFVWVAGMVVSQISAALGV
jgi:hypothetical protein